MDHNTTTEQWRAVPGYEGFYEVSDHGRVRSIDREVRGSDGRVQRLRGRALAPNLVGKGYHALSLARNGTIKREYFHRLVLAAFVGPCPEGLEVCHLDGDPLNNRLSNLRYDTRSANNLDKVGHGTATRGERNGYARMTEETVRDARARSAAGEPDRGIAATFGVHPETIAYIRRGRTWAWLA